MLMKKIDINDIDIGKCEVILDKAGRVVDGVNHGRQVIQDEEKDLYYKIFDQDYCRRQNFQDALNAGFFDELAPAFVAVIVDDIWIDEWLIENSIVGYVTEGGTPLGSEFDEIPKEFYEKVLDKAKETKMFFYDLVASNIIRTKDGELSLIDLESVYNLDELYTISKHNAKVKPDYYFTELEKLWKENMKVISFIPGFKKMEFMKCIKYGKGGIRYYVFYLYRAFSLLRINI